MLSLCLYSRIQHNIIFESLFLVIFFFLSHLSTTFNLFFRFIEPNHDVLQGPQSHSHDRVAEHDESRQIERLGGRVCGEDQQRA